MFCGMSIRAYGTKEILDLLKNDKKFHFEESGNGCYKTPDNKKCRGIIIELSYKLGYAEIRGSIHKFKNNGMQNYDTFTINDFMNTIKEFEKAFYLDKFNQKYLRNIEFGVNIKLDFDPMIVLESLIPYSGTGDFISEQSLKYSGIRIEHKGYYDIKFYNKSSQIPINKKNSVDYKYRYVLRLEIKVRNMKFLHNLAAKTSLIRMTKMSDLVHPELLEVLKDRLVEELDKLLIVDHEQLDIQTLPSKNRELYNDAWKTSYWKQFERKKNDPEKGKMKKRGERALGRLKEIISQNNDLKNHIEERLIESLTKMIDTENVAISSIWNNPRSEIFTWKKGDHNKYKERLLSRFPPDKELSKSVESANSSILIDKKKDRDMSRNPYLDKLGICDKELEQYTCCPITGLPFLVEDIKSKYLSRKQIKYYYRNYPEVYSLLLRMISIEYHHISSENQIEKIAQAIRNRASYLERKRRKIHDPRQTTLNFLE